MADITAFFDRISERQGSFVFLANRLYSVEDRQGFPDSVEVGGLCMSLVPSMGFHEMESLDSRVYSAEIFQDCQAYVAQVIDQEVRAEREMQGEADRIMALNYIVFELLPFLLSKKYSTDDHVAEMLQAGLDDANEDHLIALARAELHETLDSEFGAEPAELEDPSEMIRTRVIREARAQIRTGSIFRTRYSLEDMGVSPASVSRSLTGEITGHQPLYASDGQVFELDLVGGKKRGEMAFTINKRRYVPGAHLGTVARVSRELKDRRALLWHIGALEHSHDGFSVIKEIAADNHKKQRQMIELAKKEEYDLGNCGFILRDGTYFVYSRIPKFATQDGRDGDVFWPFPSVRVCIKVGWNAQPYTSDNAYVAEALSNHPCMYSRTSQFSHICNLSRKESSYGNSVHEMVRKLSDAVNVIMRPLNKASLDSHSGHTYFGTPLDKILKQEPLSRKQAVEQGYVVAEVIAKRVG